jgi:hypothetical protein
MGRREDFERAHANKEHLGLFIRNTIGLDREAAKQAFGAWMPSTTQRNHRQNSTLRL